jgi:hypothetical protein
MSDRRLGGKTVRLIAGVVGGAVLGLLLALPFALLVASVPPGVDPLDPRVEENRSKAVVLTFLGAITGGVLGLGLVHLLTTLPAGRWRLVSRGLVGAGCGGLLGGTAGGLVYNDMIQKGGPLGLREQVLPFGLVIFWTLVGTVIGVVVGTVRAAQSERRQRAAMLRQVDAQRVELETALEQKFGPLDEARHAAIQAWDADRLTEARRKLEEARSVEELDA